MTDATANHEGLHRASPTKTSARRFKWHYVYYALAAFDIIGISISLALSHQIMEIYLKSVQTNSTWAKRMDSYAVIGQLAVELNAPGNDIFDSGDPVQETARLKLAVLAFNTQLEKLRKDVEGILEGDTKAGLHRALAKIKGSSLGIVSEATAIHKLFANKQRSIAGPKMAAMDRHYADLTQELFKVNTIISQAQSRNFEDQVASAESLKQYKSIIAVFIMFMVLAVALYGYKLGKEVLETAKKVELSEERFHFLADMIPQIIFEATEIGDLLFLNRTGMELFKLTPEDLTKGKNLVDLAGKDDQYRLFDWIRGNQKEQANIGFNISLNIQREAHGLLYGNRTLTKENQACLIGLIVDVTDQKALKEELIKAKKIAEKHSEAKSSFLANMSHEIRTPINGVLGMLGLLVGTELKDEQRDYAKVAHSSALTLLSIINEILDFSKIEAGKLQMEEIDFKLAETLDEVAEILAPTAHKKKIELSILTGLNLPRFVTGDPGRLRQILLNLTSNAIKYTSEGEVVVKVSREDGPDNRINLRFEISDTGIGIPKDQLGRLFQSFNQGDISTTRKFGGTGLGLAICRELTGLMGGMIGVESQEGFGSTFWFTVSLKTSRSSLEPKEVFQPLKLRVLVLEDNLTKQLVYQRVLARWDCEFECVATIAKAIDALERSARNETPFGVVIVDYHLPDGTGVQFAESIHNDHRFGSIPLILASSSVRQELDDQQVSLFVRRLTKPVKYSILYSALSKLVDQSLDKANTKNSSSMTAVIEDGKRERFRILLAEDNFINRKIVTKMLKTIGFHCDFANHGGEAVEMVREQSYDLILMDCQMPVMDGYAATAAIRQFEKDKQRMPARIIALLLEGDRERCLEVGMDGYLSKPILQDQFYEKIKGEFAKTTASGYFNAFSAADLASGHEILIVDDHLTNRKVVIALLAQLGFEADEAANGKEALAAIRHQDYKLILMDCQMPVLDGFDTTIRLRQNEKTRNLPIVGITANVTKENEDHCFAVGMDEFIAKPIDRKKFSDIIGRYISLPVGRVVEEGEVLFSPMISGEKEFMQELAQSFLKDVKRLIQKMNEAHTEDNMTALKFLAHNLTESTSSVGNQSLYLLARTLEKSIDENVTADARSMVIQELEEACERAVKAIQRQLLKIS
jgi:CheY-like chemotaxis protein